jgi:peptidoglycan/LPS O-acetylase OafA/YrhL
VSSRSRRQEIQALRAVAVLLVVLFHLWPDAVPGGFVGVDVFFAISGFLITGLLLRDVQVLGTVSLPAFWARRARRLLPAPLVAVLLCAAATVAFVPRGTSSSPSSGPVPRTSRTGTSPRHRSITSPPTTRRRRCGTSGRCRPRSSSTWCGRC